MADYRPYIPAYDHHLSIFTFEDAVENVLDAFGLESRKKHSVRVARRAVIDAYRDLPNLSKWPYFERRGTIHTVAPQTTGTITYDHTGGTYERELTLSGATWPSDARLYGVLIANQQYAIEDRKSDTVVTLDKNNNPGSDIAAGTSYEAYKSLYELPTNFRRGSHLVQLAGSSWRPEYADPTETLWSHFSHTQPADPHRYTIRNGGEQYGGLLLEFGPPPASARTFDYVYEAVPRPLFYERYTDGTVSVSSTTVTGSNTTFVDRMVGSIIRFPPNASNDKLPTGVMGTVDDTDNVYAAERVITAVASTTSLTIDATVSETVSGACYTISDPIDFEPTAMLTAFKRLCEANYAAATGKKDRFERRELARQEVLQAKEAATRFRDAGRPEDDTPANYSVTIDTSSS